MTLPKPGDELTLRNGWLHIFNPEQIEVSP